MAVFLFDEIVFGPVVSRRLGMSLGINLLPTQSKVCNFNCIYCECGLTPKIEQANNVLPKAETVRIELITKLKELNQNNQSPDTITFAGNGEPTMHPEFAEIINDTIEIRDQYCPQADIAVLSNSSLIGKESVFRALKKIELNILKLDSAFESTILKINCPKFNFSISKTIENLRKFNGNFVLQSMFIQGIYKNERIDNTTNEELREWLKIVKKLRPKLIMIYTISRDTPYDGLNKIGKTKLTEIASMVREMGLNVQVSA